MNIIKQNKKSFLFLIAVFVGVLVWVIHPPEGISSQGWHLFAIFIATILGIVFKPLPMGAMAVLGLTATILTKTLTVQEAFSGFSNHIVWLVVTAFFIARGFILTGLGSRLAYFFVKLLGGTPLGLGYGMVAADLILAPTIPSVTARVGGVIYPIVKSLCKTFGSEPSDMRSSRKVGAYLIQTAFLSSGITGAMFLTAMAGNPLIMELASKANIQLSWTNWAIASIVPGLVSLGCMPYIVYKIYPPILKDTRYAKEFSKNRLKVMGKMKPTEWIMSATFIILIVLWIIGPYLEMKAAVAALVGLSILLITGVITWKDVLEEKGAWDTLFWFATLLSMAGFLNKFGLPEWFSQLVVNYVDGWNWTFGFLMLSLFYFYSHYFFASSLAHIGAMYLPFLVVSIALGTPPMLAALVLGFFSNLFGTLTHYSSGPAPILFGSGYVTIGAWWRNGFVLSLFNILVWFVVGGIWWKFLGIW